MYYNKNQIYNDMISCFYLFNNCFRIGGKSLYLLNPKSQNLKKVMALVWLFTNISVIIKLVVSQLVFT